MSFYNLVENPIGNEDFFIFNLEYLVTKTGSPYLRFDLGFSENGTNIVIRQMRLSGGSIGPPQARVGRKKLDQALLGTQTARRLYNLLLYTLGSFPFEVEIKSERWALGRIKMTTGKLEKQNELRTTFE